MKIDYDNAPMESVESLKNMMPGFTPADLPKPTSMTMPSLVATANTTIPSTPEQLTPMALNQRLPSIVNQTPMNMAPLCDPFAQFISQNMLLVGAGLALAAIMIFGSKK